MIFHPKIFRNFRVFCFVVRNYFVYLHKNKDMENVKMNKISAGYYEGVFNNVRFSIIKAEIYNKNCWYWLIGNDGGHDHFSKKSIAIEAVIEWIKEMK